MKALIPAILCASLVLTGCAVRFVPSPDMKPKEVLNLYVGILIPKAEVGRTSRIGGKTYKTGNALKVGAMNTFQQLFTNVYAVETWEQARATRDLQLVLQPRVVSFDVDPAGNATVVLACRLTNLSDQALMDSTWTGSSSQGVPGRQAAGGSDGKRDVVKSSSEAFEAAFKQMAEAVVPSLHRTSFR